MSDRCSGQCCREFCLTGKGHTPDEIRAFLREKAGPEGEQIADMLVPLRQIDVGVIAPDGTKFTVAPVGGGWVFTCKHHDPDTGDCRAYGSRPRFMCGAYPYGSPCEHKEQCTWTLGRLGLWPLVFRRYEEDAVGRVTSMERAHLPVLQPGGSANQRAALEYRADDVRVTRAAAE